MLALHCLKNKKREALVYKKQRLDVESYRTMENQSRPHVWIVGSSLVYWLARHAEEVGLYPDLALECHIEWVGVRGMRWKHLVPKLREKRGMLPSPDIMVLHVGETTSAK